MAKWIKGIFNNLISGLLVSFLGSSAVVSFIGKWISGTSWFNFLKNTHPVQGWVIVLIISGILAFIIIFIIAFIRNRSWTEKKNYLSYGLLWDLTPYFFEASIKVPASKTYPTDVRKWIRGPFCPICNTDVTDKLTDTSFECINEHDLRETEAYRILEEERRRQCASFAFKNEWWDKIRKKVYEEAQGKARNGLL